MRRIKGKAVAAWFGLCPNTLRATTASRKGQHMQTVLYALECLYFVTGAIHHVTALYLLFAEWRKRRQRQ